MRYSFLDFIFSVLLVLLFIRFLGDLALNWFLGFDCVNGSLMHRYLIEMVEMVFEFYVDW